MNKPMTTIAAATLASIPVGIGVVAAACAFSRCRAIAIEVTGANGLPTVFHRGDAT